MKHSRCGEKRGCYVDVGEASIALINGRGLV